MTNFIFPRRDIQKCLERLCNSIDPASLRILIDRLNAPGANRLPAMWEAVWLSALSSGDAFAHESPLADGHRPDFALNVAPDVQLVGDIRTVSDAGLDKQNPVDELSAGITKIALKHGMNPNHFGYHVEARRHGSYGDARVSLLLPPREELAAFIRQTVDPWVKGIKRKNLRSDQINLKREGVDFCIMYGLAKQSFAGGHLSYDVAYSKRKNPLFNALRDKTSQLSAAPDTSLRLVIACDGGCSLLSRRKLSDSSAVFTAKDIASDFLRQNSTIDIVLLTYVREKTDPISRSRLFYVEVQSVIAPEGHRSIRLTQEVLRGVHEFIERTVAEIPMPVRSAKIARSICIGSANWPDMVGGYKMSVDKTFIKKVSISSRALQRLLAGEISSEEFLARHGWSDGRKNPFFRNGREGRMVKSITVIDGGNEDDDDWLEFAFGSPDAAAGPFRMPSDEQS